MSSLKAWTRGCHRARTPDETLQTISPFMQRAGITRVSDVTGLDYPGICTAMATRPNGRSLSVTQGKGLTLGAAKASAIMEAIEHDHAEAPELPLVLGRVGQHYSRLCDVNRLPAFPRAFGELTSDTRLLWTEAEDLGSGRARLVPFEMVHLDLTLPLPEGTGHFPLSSNGLASGNTLIEATVHAVYELVERDARTLFFLSSPAHQHERRVAADTVDDPDCRDLLERYERAGLDVAIWDITTEIPVATFLAAVLEREDNVFRRVPLAYGSGAHLDRNVALLRALTEAAQTRLTNIVGTRDDTLPQHLDRARTDARQARYRNELRGTNTALRPFAAAPHASFESFEQDWDFLSEHLTRCGFDQILRVDLSRPSWPVCVVRTIIPGLEAHIDMPEYVPGSRALAARTAP